MRNPFTRFRLRPTRPTVIFRAGDEPTEYIGRLLGNVVSVRGILFDPLRPLDGDKHPLALTGEVVEATPIFVALTNGKAFATFLWRDVEVMSVCHAR